MDARRTPLETASIALHCLSWRDAGTDAVFPLGQDSSRGAAEKVRMNSSTETKRRKAHLFCLLLCSGISILWGYSVGYTRNRWVDFRAVYYGTRCLLQHHNPYNVGELESVYRAEGGERTLNTPAALQAVTLYVNMPTTFIFVAPFAMLPWGPAHVLWTAVTAGFFVLAAVLMWSLGASYALNVSTFLACLLAANFESTLSTANTAGIVVGLCVVAVWCFLQERFVWAGILCLALSLAIKPHDAGFVWLYFLLAGAPYRKRALQTLGITAILGLAAFLWVSHVAPNWMHDWHSNLAAISGRGGMNEPGLHSIFGRAISNVVDLQAAISIFRDDPRIYNPISYLVCGSLLLVWSVRTLRLRFSQRSAWLALATVTALTMLLTYHRSWDAKILMLAIPACAIMWKEGRATGRTALVVTTAALFFTADVPLSILNILLKHRSFSTDGILAQIRTLVLIRPVSLVLLAMGIFYLWIYVRPAVADRESGVPAPEEWPEAAGQG